MFKFVSGWAGFPELFPNISSKSAFYLPFVADSEEKIKNELSKGGDILAGWSTGAHIILKNIDSLADKYDKVFLFAPFFSFTEYVNPKIVTHMIKKIKLEPDDVLCDFYRRCGVECFQPVLSDTDIQNLTTGLDYLLSSKAELPEKTYENIIIVHGVNDKILSGEAAKVVSKKMNCDLISMDCGHFFSEGMIAEIINENTHKKIF